MTRPLSMDLRSRLIAAVEGGQSRRAAAKRFGVAPSTAIKWLARWHEEGNARPRRMGGDRHSQRLEAHAAVILALIEATPDTTPAEMTAHLEGTHTVKVAVSSVWPLLGRYGMSVKKNRARRRAAAA